MVQMAFFKHVYSHGKERVNEGKPTLLAANHPTAFVDPMLMVSFLDQPIYNMTRGDIFQKPFFKWFLGQINMFPVFRQREGYGDVDRNDGVFDYCIKQLEGRKTVSVFVEGEHHLDKTVRPCKKGIARIAFGAMEKGISEDLQIVPQGCNYWYGDRPRDVVYLLTGEPIAVAPFYETYKTSPGLAVRSLVLAIEAALKKICFHLENSADEPLANRLLEIKRSEKAAPYFNFLIEDKDTFYAEKAILDKLNQMPAAEKMALSERVNAYFEKLEKHGLSDFALANSKKTNISRLLLIGWTWPLFLLGFISRFPVAFPARYIANKKAKKREFYTSLYEGVGYILGLLYYGFIMLFALIFAAWPIKILALLLPVIGWFSLVYEDAFRDHVAIYKTRNVSQMELARLLKERESLLGSVVG